MSGLRLPSLGPIEVVVSTVASSSGRAAPPGSGPRSACPGVSRRTEGTGTPLTADRRDEFPGRRPSNRSWGRPRSPRRASDRVARTVSRYVEHGAIPGAVWLVAHGDEVHTGAVGHPAIESAEPLGHDAIFRISSMTKPITAVAALSCVEDGLFRLDEPVDRLLPELADRCVLEHEDAPLSWTVPARRPILVRDLLTFTMGMGIVMAPPGAMPLADALVDLQLGQGPPAPDVPPEPDEWLRRLGTLPLLHQPGERWAYNTGADVLGVLIARATGQPFEHALRERVLDPVGMHDTAFWVPARGSSTASSPATSPTRRPEPSGCTTAPTASGAARPRSPRARPGSCRRSTTTTGSRGCCSPSDERPRVGCSRGRRSRR